MERTIWVGHLAFIIRHLPDDYQIILSLIYEQDLTTREAARVMCLTDKEAAELHIKATHAALFGISNCVNH